MEHRNRCTVRKLGLEDKGVGKSLGPALKTDKQSLHIHGSVHWMFEREDVELHNDIFGMNKPCGTRRYW